MIVRDSCGCGASFEIGPAMTYGVMEKAHRAFLEAHAPCRERPIEVVRELAGELAGIPVVLDARMPDGVAELRRTVDQAEAPS